MRQFNCGYWVIEQQLANLRWDFEHVGSYTSDFILSGFRRVFRRVFAGDVGPFTSGFCRVFVGLFGRVEPIYVGFWSWVALVS